MNDALWLVQAVLAALFGMAGLTKSAKSPTSRPRCSGSAAAFVAWGRLGPYAQ